MQTFCQFILDVVDHVREINDAYARSVAASGTQPPLIHELQPDAAACTLTQLTTPEVDSDAMLTDVSGYDVCPMIMSTCYEYVHAHIVSVVDHPPLVQVQVVVP